MLNTEKENNRGELIMFRHGKYFTYRVSVTYCFKDDYDTYVDEDDFISVTIENSESNMRNITKVITDEVVKLSEEKFTDLEELKVKDISLISSFDYKE